MTEHLYSAAIEAADELLHGIYRLDVAKALDPLNERDFLVIVQRLARALTGVSRDAEAAALRRALAALDVDWPTLSAAAQEQVVRAAQRALGDLPDTVLPRVDQIFEIEAPNLAARSRRATVRRFGLHIGTTTTRTDERIAAFVRKSESNFVRDQYGRRRDELAQRTRDIVAAGLERGLGRDDIVADLSVALAPIVNRGKPYWEVVAMSFANRGRTYTQLAAFEDAGVERYRFDSILDQVTSHVCRFMHGRQFTVARAMLRFDEVENASDPEAIADLQPWMRVGSDGDGNQVLFYERGGRRRLVAQIDEPGVGRRDQVGRYSRALSNDQLEAAGLMMPPLHGRCRSTLVRTS